MTFVAGAHVFPGGTIDDARRAWSTRRRAATGSTRRRASRTSTSRASVACRVAAARELVEEAGRPARPAARDAGRRATRPRPCAGGSTTGVPFEQASAGRRLAPRARRSRPVRADRDALLGAAALRHPLLPGRAPARGRGAARRRPSPTSSSGRRRPRRSARGLTGEARPPAADVADPDAARGLRLGRRRARVGEEQADRTARAPAHDGCRSPADHDPGRRNRGQLLLRGRARLAAFLDVGLAGLELDRIEAKEAR